MSEFRDGASQEQEHDIQQMVILPEIDKLLAEGRLEEKGRRMVNDLSPGDVIKVFGTDGDGNRVERYAKVVEFSRPPLKKDLIIEWVIELLDE